MTADDFVDVKLSAAGETMAAGCMRIHGGNYEYCFVPGETLRLSAAEFSTRLGSMTHEELPVFEIVTVEQPAADTKKKRS